LTPPPAARHSRYVNRHALVQHVSAAYTTPLETDIAGAPMTWSVEAFS